jgi:glycosyltransferase involved in cell wall biosynthesis
MLVSIIMPTYNSANTLDDAVRSVLAQDYTLWELVIIDDQSSDKSLEIAETYAVIDPRISVLRTGQNVGSGGARNVGIDSSKGQLIAFLDSDDLWLPNKLDVQVKMFSDNRVSFVCSAYQRFNSVTHKTKNVGVPRLITFRDLLKTNYIGCLTVVLRRDAFNNLKFPEMRKRQDYALWLSLIRTGGNVHCSNHVLARYRHGHESTTSNKVGSVMSTWKVYREFLQLKFPSSIFCFLNYLIRGVLRTKFPRLSLFLGFSYSVKE